MIEVTILIPLADNGGRIFDAEHHHAFENHVLEHFGGLSRQTQRIAGAWMDGGRVYRDTNLLYIIALESILDGGKLREVIDLAKRHYHQEAIYLRYLGVAEIR